MQHVIHSLRTWWASTRCDTCHDTGNVMLAPPELSPCPTCRRVAAQARNGLMQPVRSVGVHAKAA